MVFCLLHEWTEVKVIQTMLSQVSPSLSGVSLQTGMWKERLSDASQEIALLKFGSLLLTDCWRKCVQWHQARRKGEEAVVSWTCGGCHPDVSDGTCQEQSIWPMLEFEGIISWSWGLGRKPISWRWEDIKKDWRSSDCCDGKFSIALKWGKRGPCFNSAKQFIRGIYLFLNIK